ncbi:MAG: hypothetical protein HRU23_20295 [Gammaproteobacteria bacterium]|nr:hypothetical protein [Gammaproteobacteria bacterium]
MTNVEKSNNNSWVFHETKPLAEGKYLARMDDDDNEPMTVEITDGKAKVNGKDRIFINYEWQIDKATVDLYHVKNLPTSQERARYLLGFEITTSIEFVDLTPVLKAFVGDIGLPIHSKGKETSKDVIAKAKAWLEETAA